MFVIIQYFFRFFKTAVCLNTFCLYVFFLTFYFFNNLLAEMFKKKVVSGLKLKTENREEYFKVWYCWILGLLIVINTCKNIILHLFDVEIHPKNYVKLYSEIWQYITQYIKSCMLFRTSYPKIYDASTDQSFYPRPPRTKYHEIAL